MRKAVDRYNEIVREEKLGWMHPCFFLPALVEISQHKKINDLFIEEFQGIYAQISSAVQMGERLSILEATDE